MRRRRGLVLILAIFFLGLLQLLVLAFARRLPLELYGSVRYELDNEAFLAADAGIQHTLAWLEQKLEQGVEPVPAPPSVTRTGRLNDFDWAVEVRPDAQTPPNAPAGGQRAYWLISQAKRGNVVHRTISLGVKQESFAYYARLVDSWPPGITSLAGEEAYSGPVHTNSALRVGLSADYVTSGPVLFKSGASYSIPEYGSPDQVDYPNPGIYPGPRPYAGTTKSERAKRYKRLYGSQGRKGVRRHKPIPMPSPDENLRQFSWGPAPLPAAPGVYLQSAGGALTNGVFIQGDVASLKLEDAGGQARQRIRLANGDDYVITELSNDTTEIQGPGGTVTRQKHPNGLLYCEGDILGLEGVNRGPHTVAVGTGANHKVTLKGSITPATPVPLGSPTADGSDSFGLIAHSLVIPNETTLPRIDRHVYGALLLIGGDGQGGVEAANPSSGNFAHLYFVGSVTTQQVHITMYPSGPTGWAEHFAYDKNLRTSPPPAFPGLSELQVVAYTCDE